MDVLSSKAAGWTLVVGGFLLLVAMGRLGLAVVLIPMAAAVAYGVTRSSRANAPARRGLQ
jgi:hypothetical protein